MLNLLEGYDLKAWGFNSPETLHAMVEAKKLAFADRAKYYADPDFAKIPLARFDLEKLRRATAQIDRPESRRAKASRPATRR